MEEKICQSCGMTMAGPDKFGTNADGSKNEEYCCYCWEVGKFADWCKDMSLDQMIENNIRFVLEGGAAKTEDEARSILKKSIPKLRRWAAA
jgi:hypothetical protein